MGRPSYMRSVVDRNVVMRHVTVVIIFLYYMVVYIFWYKRSLCSEKQKQNYCTYWQ